MPMRNLYFSIYLTVVAVLLAFALVAGLLVRSHVGGERGRIETVVNQRTVALGELLANSLPDAAAPVDDQASAVQDWARRMRVPLALDARDGQRIVASASFERLQAESPERVDSAVRIPLGDGRKSGWLPPKFNLLPGKFHYIMSCTFVTVNSGYGFSTGRQLVHHTAIEVAKQGHA